MGKGITSSDTDKPSGPVDGSARLGEDGIATDALPIRVQDTRFSDEVRKMSDDFLRPLILLNTVGLTSRLLSLAPRLRTLADQGWSRPLLEVVPAVTLTAQATLLTGKLPNEHGVVGNGWLFRDTMEVRFWQQSHRLLVGEPLYSAARRLARSRGLGHLKVAKLFWWFNQGADVQFSLTPKPYYGADGDKVFAIAGQPTALPDRIQKSCGPFPFFTFWGPKAGLPATEWIARAAAEVIRQHEPHLTLVYLPHLDYEPQRRGPSGTDMATIVGQLDRALEPLFDVAHRMGARIWVVNEYGHVDVDAPIYPNRLLRTNGLLETRAGPFGESIDPYSSAAFAVCDHQWCHVYVNDAGAIPRVTEVLHIEPGIARLFIGSARREIGLDHPRAGEIVAMARPDRWFAYPFWMNDSRAPDFARTVDIHRKPGFDPCEMFFDPDLLWPTGRMARRLIQKRLGFRTLFDVIPLDASIVRGSHGLIASDSLDRPVMIGDGPPPSEEELPMTAFRELLLKSLWE